MRIRAIIAASALALFGATGASAATWYASQQTAITGALLTTPISAFDFGTVRVGEPEPYEFLILKIATHGASSSNPLSISVSTLKAPFSEAIFTGFCSPGDGSSICASVGVRFDPPVDGHFADTLTVSYSGSTLAEPAGSASIPVKGVGVTPLPATLPLFAAGLFGLLGWRKVRRGCVGQQVPWIAPMLLVPSFGKRLPQKSL